VNKSGCFQQAGRNQFSLLKDRNLTNIANFFKLDKIIELNQTIAGFIMRNILTSVVFLSVLLKCGIAFSQTHIPKDSSINLYGLDSLYGQVYSGEIYRDSIRIGNDGTSSLEYQVRFSYFPTDSGYYWSDSDSDSAAGYDWIDISGYGSELIIDDEEVSSELNIGFDFDFYDNIYNSVRICSNGYLIFDSNYNDYYNFPIPEPDFEPNNFIAAFWDDLDPSARGGVFYYSDSTNDRFIVQYEGISQYDSLSINTFQTILYSNGMIKMQYKSMNGKLDECTVGIENSDASEGVEICYNHALIKDEYALLIRPVVEWAAADPESGTINPSESDYIHLNFHSNSLIPSGYNAEIVLTTNDQNNLLINIPLSFDIVQIGIPVQILPENMSATADLTPTFTWAGVPEAQTYTIYVDDNSAFSTPDITHNTSLTTYSPSADLSIGTYFWKVKASINGEFSGSSNIWSFETGEYPVMPVLVSPADSFIGTDLTPTFDWNNVIGATSYTLLIDDSSDFDSPVITEVITESTFTPLVEMLPDVYYWKVMAENRFGQGQYSQYRSIRLQIIPDIPSGIVTSIVSGNVKIDWNDAANATGYDVYFSNDPYAVWPSGWGTPVYTSVSEYTYSPSETKKFFRIVSKNGTKESSPSEKNSSLKR
jgi:hypothetical protein